MFYSSEDDIDELYSKIVLLWQVEMQLVMRATSQSNEATELR
jgi:hypothetical protein